MDLTLLDWVLGLALLVSVLAACHRGLGREMLHTVLFGIAVAAGYVLFRTQAQLAGQGTQAEVAFWVMQSIYYLISSYVLTWAVMKLLGPLIIGWEEVGIRSRFWAGIVSMVKLGAVIFGLNLWFAVHSPDPSPQRLLSLPLMMQDSVLIQLSNALTDDAYAWLVQNNVMAPPAADAAAVPPPLAPDEVPTPTGTIPAAK
jgi:uncharacterized membrane protein required for colicin V production